MSARPTNARVRTGFIFLRVFFFDHLYGELTGLCRRKDNFALLHYPGGKFIGCAGCVGKEIPYRFGGIGYPDRPYESSFPRQLFDKFENIAIAHRIMKFRIPIAYTIALIIDPRDGPRFPDPDGLRYPVAEKDRSQYLCVR